MPGFERLLDTLPAPKPPAAKERDLRAMAIAADKLTSGKTITELASEYNLSRQGVKDALTRADQAGFYENYKTLVLERLVPKALGTIEAHLDRGNLEAAKMVLDFIQKSSASGSPQDAQELTIEAYRVVRAAKAAIEPPRGPVEPQEGTVTSEPHSNA